MLSGLLPELLLPEVSDPWGAVLDPCESLVSLGLSMFSSSIDSLLDPVLLPPGVVLVPPMLSEGLVVAPEF